MNKRKKILIIGLMVIAVVTGMLVCAVENDISEKILLY